MAHCFAFFYALSFELNLIFDWTCPLSINSIKEENLYSKASYKAPPLTSLDCVEQKQKRLYSMTNCM